MNHSALPFHILIAAAGSGARFGAETPKQYCTLEGISILRRTLNNVLACPGLQSCHVIINPDHKALYHDAIEGLDLPDFIAGSNTRKNSISNGLKSISYLKNNDVVLIHDAARPFVSHQDILDVVNAAHEHGSAAIGHTITDTLKRSTKDDLISESLKRDHVWSLQTPQGFHYKLISQAHDQGSANASDDTSLVQALGNDIKLIEGSRSNIKITTAQDMDLAQSILQAQNTHETRTGMGFDVHAFDTPENSDGAIRLCGVDIPHPQRLKGHSDADVGLHAITDAIYGALGAGDIGTHFPPSNDTFKNMDSAVFLEHACEMVMQRGGHTLNLDLTFICEAPKIGPHRDAMITRLSDITGLPENRLSIKATTSEQLGFTGRGEGIAAQAIATIKVPTS